MLWSSASPVQQDFPALVTPRSVMRKWRIHLASASGFAPKTDSAAISIMAATESLVGATIPRQRSIPPAKCGLPRKDIPSSQRTLLADWGTFSAALPASKCRERRHSPIKSERRLPSPHRLGGSAIPQTSLLQCRSVRRPCRAEHDRRFPL